MKILIITRSSWDNMNSLGNTMSNIWEGWDSDKIANIYCRNARPNNNVCKLYYSICDKDLIKSIFNKKYIVGKVLKDAFLKNTGLKENENSKMEKRIYDYFRNSRFVLFYWLQEIIWKIGKWKNMQFDDFLSKFKPDIIFSACFPSFYTHELLWYIQKKTKAKVILFHADDYLSYKGMGGTILERINRKIRSKIIETSSKKADLNFCISEKQKDEYERKLGIKTKLLYKGKEFNEFPNSIYQIRNKIINIVYTGSILNGRWRTIYELAKAIKKINENTKDKKYNLSIYSQYKPKNKVLKLLDIKDVSKFYGKINSNQIPEVYRNSDILLHVESFDNKEKLETRLSFSTKIVDYLSSGRCIMAIGWSKSASIEYLAKNDAAVIANSKEEIFEKLKEIINDPEIINIYANKAWNCGRRNHQIENVKSKFVNDISSVLNN